MKTKIVYHGKIFKVKSMGFPYLWWSDLLPSYDSWEEAEEASFRVFGVVAQNTMEKTGTSPNTPNPQ